MRAFKVIAGTHNHREGTARQATEYGKGCPAGDIVRTHDDLCAKFPNKFQELVVDVQPDVQPAVQPNPAAEKPAPDAATEQSGEESTSKRKGTAAKEEAAEPVEQVDVTEQFPKAVANRFFIYKRSTGYFVADADSPKKFANKKPLKKGEIDAYIAELVS